MLTPKQVAERVGVSKSLVYQWCREGVLEHLRLGTKGRRGKVLIEPTTLDRFLDSCKPERRPPFVLRHIRQ